MFAMCTEHSWSCRLKDPASATEGILCLVIAAMFYYSAVRWSSLVSVPLSVQSHVFRDALFIATVSNTLSFALCLVVGFIPELRSKFELGESCYGSFTTVLGLLVVIRTSQASDRFWGGLHGIMGDWFDAASTVVSFCRMSKADPTEVQGNIQLLIRLMSLLSWASSNRAMSKTGEHTKRSSSMSTALTPRASGVWRR